MQILVGITPVRIPLTGGDTPVLQNLGPGIVYFGGADVSTTEGLRLEVNATYEFPIDLANSLGSVWIVADMANTDVRYLGVG